MREYHRILRLAVTICGRLYTVQSEEDFVLGLTRDCCSNPQPLVETPQMTSQFTENISSGFPNPKDGLYSSQLIGLYQIQTGQTTGTPAAAALTHRQLLQQQQQTDPADAAAADRQTAPAAAHSCFLACVSVSRPQGSTTSVLSATATGSSETDGSSSSSSRLQRSGEASVEFAACFCL